MFDEALKCYNKVLELNNEDFTLGIINVLY